MLPPSADGVRANVGDSFGEIGIQARKWEPVELHEEPVDVQDHERDALTSRTLAVPPTGRYTTPRAGALPLRSLFELLGVGERGKDEERQDNSSSLGVRIPANFDIKGQIGIPLLAFWEYAFPLPLRRPNATVFYTGPVCPPPPSARPRSTIGTRTGRPERGDERPSTADDECPFHSFFLGRVRVGYADGGWIHAEDRVNGRLEAYPRPSFPSLTARAADGDVALIPSSTPPVLSPPSRSSSSISMTS
ncbi:hypothetical protein B0H13DRAFT_2671863 [Mycena leptocephala]|nr:hypothetical protein B0H13DRAFT_2684415 [Mycena leptocephala]KAJ7834019.1 hypothetical protein B0H13DRAFT_2678736 [Mycena leptocephala]KAJ7861355.1 hypothetical protein B0H13DRAFT_2671863 [Mycena leptocephala]